MAEREAGLLKDAGPATKAASNQAGLPKAAAVGAPAKSGAAPVRPLIATGAEVTVLDTGTPVCAPKAGPINPWRPALSLSLGPLAPNKVRARVRLFWLAGTRGCRHRIVFSA